MLITCCLCSQCVHHVPTGYLGPRPQCEELEQSVRELLLVSFVGREMGSSAGVVVYEAGGKQGDRRQGIERR
jgi:hypothetical protein